MIRNSPSIARAIEVFARGFCFTRSFTHPFVAEQLGPVWVMRDAPRSSGDYRTEEYIAHGVSPAEIDRIARRNTRGRFAVCAIHGIDEPDQPIRADFKTMGYRLRASEALMIHKLQRIPRCDSPAKIQRVTTEKVAERLAKAAGSRQILPEYLCDDAKMRQYMAMIGGKPVGWVRSIAVGDATWCSNMFVLPKFRRKGIARAMLCQMLRDDRALGARNAVLLASHAGAKLYPIVGYEQIGTLLLYSPGK